MMQAAMQETVSGKTIVRGKDGYQQAQKLHTALVYDVHLQVHIEKYNLPICLEDMTVRAVKLTAANGVSAYDPRLKYVPGQRTLARDYRSDHSCGQGLHFAGSQDEARKHSTGAYLAHVVDVDLFTATSIRADKFKAKWCIVRGLGNERNFDAYGYEDPPPAELQMATAWW